MIVRPGLRPLMLATLLVGIASLNGCKAAARTLGNPLIVHNHQAAQSLIGIAGAQLDASDRMLATTFTTNDHAPVTSSFGRMASQRKSVV